MSPLLEPLPMDLQESEGAKKILKKYEGKIALVDSPEPALDIDTLEDYEKLKQLTLPAWNNRQDNFCGS